MGLFATLSKNEIQHYFFSVIMSCVFMLVVILNVVRLNVFMLVVILNVVRLNVIMLIAECHDY